MQQSRMIARHSRPFSGAGYAGNLIAQGTHISPRFAKIRQNSRRGNLAATSQTTSAPASQYAAARRTLTTAIESAVKREDYKTAAQLKRELQEINEQDPFFKLTLQLQACISEQRYTDAAKLKAQLEALEAELGPPPIESDVNIQTSSDTITSGVRVRIKSTYRPEDSSPHLNQYYFSYHVSIFNESDKVVQLKQRHWVIRDSSGKTEEVRGPGVIGKQPILLPGRRFEYDSACPLRTPIGSMEGEFNMWVLSESDGEFKEQFEAKVGRFKLSAKEE